MNHTTSVRTILFAAASTALLVPVLATHDSTSVGANGPAAPRPIEITADTLAALRAAPAIDPGHIVLTNAEHGTHASAFEPTTFDLSTLDLMPLDDFEVGPWPDRARWPLVADLNPAGGTGIGHFWAPSGCEASGGLRSLRAIGGGDGAALPCDAPYPADIASSALLYLDLRPYLDAGRLELRFDAWLDAEPDEGLMVNHVSFDASGVMEQRRILLTATGRSRAWWPGMTLDLTRLEDRLDSGWTGDLRGHRAYIEFLFVSHDGSLDATGAYVDNVLIDFEIPPTPTASPTPPPTATPTPLPTATPAIVDRINACRTISDCDSLTIRAYTDYGCDGRFQPGVDAPLSGARVRVTADAELLGAELSRTGFGTFRFPHAGLVTSELTLPDGYEMCPGSPNPAVLEGHRFSRTGRASITFGIRRIR